MTSYHLSVTLTPIANENRRSVLSTTARTAPETPAHTYGSKPLELRSDISFGLLVRLFFWRYRERPSFYFIYTNNHRRQSANTKTWRSCAPSFQHWLRPPLGERESVAARSLHPAMAIISLFGAVSLCFRGCAHAPRRLPWSRGRARMSDGCRLAL